jgi:hypothetical protein
MISNSIKSLIQKTASSNLDDAMHSLTDLGLLIERHTQNRYADKDYLLLFGSNEELYHLVLKNDEVEYIVQFLFYHIMNIQIHPVTVAWCLGKCYGFDIYDGIINLFKIFKGEDDICQQLIFSMTSLFEREDMYYEIYCILEKPVKEGDLPLSAIALSERINLD